MFKFFRRHRTVLMVALAACIGGLTLFGLGGNLFVSSPQDAIFSVNGKKVTEAQFDRLYRQIVRQRPDLSTTQQQQVLGETLNELIRQEVFYQEAKKYGIQVTDQELQMQLASVPAFQKDGKFDYGTYLQALGRLVGTSPMDFEADRKKELAARKMNALIASAVHVPNTIVEPELAKRMAEEKDRTKRKELQENPDSVREELRDKDLNLVFSDWLTKLNAGLRVEILSPTFRERLNPPAAPAQ